MIELHPFQKQSVEDIRAVYRAGARRPLLVSPTGSGKTVMFSFITQGHVAKGGRVLILVHRQELMDQVAEMLGNFDTPFGGISPDWAWEPSKAVQVASVFTMVRRTWNPTLIIVDEGHHACGSTTWGKVIAAHPKARVLGVTATPIRLSGEGLSESFDVLVQGPTTQQLIEQGHLSRFRTFCPSTPDLSAVHKRMGDFKISELVSAVDRPSLTGDAVTQYRRHALGRQGVAFCVSVEHAKHVADDFKSAGIAAMNIDGGLPREWRRDIVRDFKAKKLQILTSCDLISEGFDCPGIEVGISLRPTHSLGLWLQQFGRCLRVAPGKTEAIMLDHAGNAMRHGLPTDPREWSLEGTASAKGPRTPSIRVCPECFAAMAAYHPKCIQCGHQFVAAPRQIERREGALEEMTPEQLEEARAAQAATDKKALEILTNLGRRRGYGAPEQWARHVLAGQKKKKTRSVTPQPKEAA